MGMERDIHFSRLRRLIIGRPLVVTPLLGVVVLFNFGSIQNTAYATIFYALIGLTWCLTFLYLLSLPGIKNLNRFTLIQIVADICMIAVLTGVTGGVESPFSILYIVTIVSAAVFFYQTGGVLTATVSLFLLGSVLFTREDLRPIFLPLMAFQEKELLYRVLLHAIAFYSSGEISGRFFSQLNEKERGTSKLRVLHETIVKNIPSGIITTDENGRITTFNPAAAQIIGVDADEAIGTVWWDLFAWKEIERQYSQLALHGNPIRFEGEIQKRNGTHCFLGVTISPLRNDLQETIGVSGIFQDLTPLKKLEEEMNQKRWLALIGEMAAGMAHEIRNPLTSLSGSVQLLKGEPSFSEENRRLMEIVLDETDRLNNIITEFILYAKPLPPRRKWILLRELMADCLQLIQNAPEAAKQVVRVIQETDPSALIFVDPDQMKQVFWNLSINAFQAMPEGGTLTLRVKAIKKKLPLSESESIQIDFEDTGVGIKKEFLPKIFYPFFTTKSSGSGLGLPLVQRVIDQHGGTISPESRVDGTTFRILLPQEERPVSEWNPLSEIIEQSDIHEQHSDR
jgi:two-component system sensor histidine kinase PilS (NtrC family)